MRIMTILGILTPKPILFVTVKKPLCFATFFQKRRPLLSQKGSLCTPLTAITASLLKSCLITHEISSFCTLKQFLFCGIITKRKELLPQYSQCPKKNALCVSSFLRKIIPPCAVFPMRSFLFFCRKKQLILNKKIRICLTFFVIYGTIKSGFVCSVVFAVKAVKRRARGMDEMERFLSFFVLYAYVRKERSIDVNKTERKACHEEKESDFIAKWHRS